MFKFNRKNLTYVIALLVLLFILSTVIPALRNPLLETLKFPLTFFSALQREINGIVFYHRNMVENKKLRDESGLLKNKLNTATEILLENDRLRQLLGFKKQTSFKVIVASVIGHSLENWSSELIINKGESSGIKKGYVVINYLGLAGRVAQATKSSSKIKLINDPDFAVSAIIQRNRQEGLVTGTLGNYLLLKYLPQDCDVAVSDVVVTSGLTENYPKGLLIGTIIATGEEFSGLSRYAVLKPAVDPTTLEEVLVIIP